VASMRLQSTLGVMAEGAGPVSPNSTLANDQNSLLAPYVSRLVIEWLRREPGANYRCVHGTGLFADISGFTKLTEKLARRGKAGAEEMGDVLNAMFEELLGAAYQYGAGLIKWGGDAVLLLFDGERHAEMACRAAYDMQAVIRRIGRIETSSGAVRLRMSIGIHSGALDFFLVGERFKELIVTGPAASTIARMETDADAGQIVVSTETAAALGRGPLLGGVKGSGRLLVGAPDVPRDPRLTSVPAAVDLSRLFCDPLRQHLLGGAVEAEHRNVAVAFVEFQGADALIRSQGPAVMAEAVEEFVTTCQVAAEENEVTFLSSDVIDDGAKVILLSGAPTNWGDVEARVLATTRKVVDARCRLPVKAGINRGRVFAGDYGPSYRRVYSITGDSVNLAARLMAKAEHGQIVVMPSVLSHSRTKFEAVTLEPFMVKGKSAPIDAVVLGQPVEDQPGRSGDLPLIGRDDEFARLMAAEQRAGAGHGRVVELVGPAGIGKSRLLNELVSASSAQVLWANGDIYQGSTPFLPLQRMFRQQLDLGSDPHASEVARALEALVESAAPQLKPWLPLLGVVVGVEMPMTEQVRVMGPEARKERLEWATSEALGHLLVRPTILVFNDLYYMDVATVDVVRRLAQDAADRPWLIVAAQRTGWAHTFTPEAHVEVMDLGPLGGAAADALLQAATATAPLSQHRLAALGERAGGNPLFLLELAAGANDLDELPDSVEGVISARIDVLEPEQRRVLRSAAVLGMTVDLSLLRTIMSIDGSTGSQSFDRWESLEEFLQPTGPDQVDFVHHLVRDTAYAGLSFRRRTLLHGRIADVLEARWGSDAAEHAALLSGHCFFGGRFAAAWDYSRAGGHRARARYANADAAELYRRALASSERLPSVNPGEFVSLCESLGTVYDDLGEFDHAEEVLARARVKAAGDRVRQASVELHLAIIRQRMGRASVALRGLGRGLRALEDCDSEEASRLRAALLTRYAWTRQFQGKYREVIRWADRGIAEATKCGDESLVAFCLEAMEWGWIGIGQIPDDSPARRALSTYEELDDVAGQASTLNTLGAREYYLGNWNQALGYYDRSLQAYRACDTSWGTVVPMASQAEILCDQGRIELAEPIALEALRIVRGANMPNDVAFVHTILGRIEMHRGQFGPALDHFAVAAEHHERTGAASLLLQIQGFVAECRVKDGKPYEALEIVSAALDAAVGLDDGEFALPLLERVHAVALARTGRIDEGIRFLGVCLEKARSRAALPEMAWTLRDLTGLAGGDHAAGEAWVSEFGSLKERLGLV
jgi:class 3 adenylate cyclase/tetratricopeptide (TPR) repeat protein